MIQLECGWAVGLLAVCLAGCLAVTVRAAEVQPEWRVIYERDFTRGGLLEDWSLWQGAWRETAAGLEKITTDEDGILLLRTPVVRGAVKIEFTAQGGAKAGDLSLFLGVSETDIRDAAFIGFGSADNTLNTIRVPGGEPALHASPLIAGDRPQRVTILREAGRLTLEVDGAKVLSAPDSKTGYPGPYIALYAWHQALFREIRVSTRPDPVLEEQLEPRVLSREQGYPAAKLMPLAAERNRERIRRTAAAAAADHLGRAAMLLPATHVIAAKQPGRYLGWPSVARTAQGELLAVFSGDRDEHICPYGKTQLIRSRDGGLTWSAPETITDSPIDDRDAGILALADGTLLVNWFTSLAFSEGASGYPEAFQKKWTAYGKTVPQAEQEKLFGYWLRRSTDGGKTWGDWIRTPVSSPHGPIELRDGCLLYVGWQWNRATGRSGIKQAFLAAAESRDRGLTWTTIWQTNASPDLLQAEERAALAVALGTNAVRGTLFAEPHAAQLPNGKIVALIRNDTGAYLLQTDSLDGGKSWTPVRTTPMKGYPPHLLVLKDGRLLATYGYRFPPYGQRACFSHDGGETWDMDHEIILRADAPDGDLGYPASAEIGGGRIVTVYYQVDKAGEKTCLMATRWTPPPPIRPAKP